MNENVKDIYIAMLGSLFNSKYLGDNKILMWSIIDYGRPSSKNPSTKSQLVYKITDRIEDVTTEEMGTSYIECINFEINNER